MRKTAARVGRDCNASRLSCFNFHFLSLSVFFALLLCTPAFARVPVLSDPHASAVFTLCSPWRLVLFFSFVLLFTFSLDFLLFAFWILDC